MSRQINQPINQVRLTNVAVVRMNKGGSRFEIACYRNKVVDYRQGLETDLSEVLQTDRVFTNVSKGAFAKAKDLQKVFGTKDEEEIAKIILKQGNVQVSDKERGQQLEKTIAQVAEWISKNCVHPSSDRPYTIAQIRHAMSTANFSVHPTKPLKRQYLDCVKLLQGTIPIQRAKMELLLVIGNKDDCETIESTMKENDVTWTNSTSSDDATGLRYNVLVDPSMYRIFNDAIVAMKGSRIEIINQIVTKQGDVKLESVDHIQSDMQGLSVVNSEAPIANAYVENTIADDDGDDNDEDIMDSSAGNRRKQKKAKKKNQKAQRRNESGGSTLEEAQEVASSTSGATSTIPTVAPSQGDGTDTRKSCNTCGGFFDSAAEYRSHFKSDWHKFNQKLKMKGTPPVSLEEFNLCDADTFFGGGDDMLL
ncbi:unnamed protein product [Cylindrotheca closterium]|uniref:C2H2-type domain-containing protein n=1 Tax=Cylindrotheca closterium TaxID=2856 RepID=A0AAD2CA78_9STRA|nr:unnamed protein product [Cylindrotheca closterium]